MFDKLLSKFSHLRTLRVLGWTSRFRSNSRKHRLKGPLTTNELLKQRKLIIRKVQLQYSDTEKFKKNQKQLNVKVSEEGLYQCFVRIQGEHPILILKESVLAGKSVEEAHILTIHRGDTLAMANIRSEYWIPSLRQLVKKTIKKCYGCKRFSVSHYPEPSMGLLPVERTTQNLPFKIIVVDFTGPLLFKTKGGKETKVYISLFTCSLTRAIHLELLQNQSAQEFILALKQFIARRGRASVIYSDNAKTFAEASKWLVKSK